MESVTSFPLYRVIIAGSRDFDDYNIMCEHCDKFLSQKNQTHSIVIISGTAREADKLGERYAHERDYDVQQFPANWKRDGKAAASSEIARWQIERHCQYD